MTIRLRIFFAILVTMGIGLLVFVNWITGDLEPQFRESTEEPLVDTAWALAAMASTRVENGIVHTAHFREAFGTISPKITSAPIYDFIKNSMDLRIYITDIGGMVIFDSTGRDEGKDYSRWNDVVRTLRGEYGARTTRDLQEDATSSVMYVAAPITTEGKIVGVLSVGKPTRNVTAFVAKTRRKIIWGALLSFGAVLLATLLLSAMITRPVERLITYAKSVSRGSRTVLPRLGRGEMATLGQAFEEMRSALEGKQYVESYIQTLTHEMKTPIAAIKGAAELLREEMPVGRREQFLDNVDDEVLRMEQLIERLPLLSSMESRQTLRKVEAIDLAALVRETAAAFSNLSVAREVALDVVAGDPVVIRGETFLVRQAVINILQNALEFSSRGGRVRIETSAKEDEFMVTVDDQGPGIPEYALSQVFARFYSLKRPDTGKKSSGLGLSIVREAMVLHGGSASLENLPDGGARAVLSFPA